MESQLDILLSRILNEYVFVPEKGLRMYYPTKELEYEANVIVHDILSSFSSYGASNLIIAAEVWGFQAEKEFEDKKQEIDNLKAQLYQSFFKTSQANAVRSKLEQVKDSFFKLLETRSSLDKYSIEGVAEHSRLAFFIENCTYKGSELYDWSDWSLDSAVAFWKQNIIDEYDIRKIARYEDWLSMYNASKTLNMPLFGKSAVDLNADQRRLIMWSNIYDSISQLQDKPSEEIIDDADAFDGFLIVKRRERKNESSRSAFESSLTQKERDADELYLVPDTANLTKSLEDIRNSNSRQAQMALEARKSAIKKLKEGESIKHGAFSDVKERMLIEANKAENRRR